MTITPIMSRRQFAGGSAAGAVLLLSGCASMGGLSLTEAIRRLLVLSSQNAFAILLQPNGFYDNSLARIALPPQLGGAATQLPSSWSFGRRRPERCRCRLR